MPEYEEDLYCFYVTFDCNWNCDYCSEETHNKPHLSEEKVLSNAKLIRPKTTVTLSGGEPGTISKELLSGVLSILEEKECIIEVNTNGLFFKKHPEYCDRIDKFFYHCSENFKDDIYIPNINSDIEYLLVVSDNNFMDVEEYVRRYPDIKFKLFGSMKTDYTNGKKNIGLSLRNGVKVYRELKDVIDSSSKIELMCQGMGDTSCQM